MSQPYFYISLASSILVILGYAPEIYSLSYSLFFKTSYNEYNSIIIWIIWITSSLLGVAYSYFIGDYFVMASYSITAVLNTTVGLLRYYNFRPVSRKEQEQIIIPTENHNEDFS